MSRKDFAEALASHLAAALSGADPVDVVQYAARKKNPDLGQPSLFETSAKPYLNELGPGRWITIHSSDHGGESHGGHRVYIGDDGKMKTGRFAGKTMAESFGSKPKEKRSTKRGDKHEHGQPGLFETEAQPTLPGVGPGNYADRLESVKKRRDSDGKSREPVDVALKKVDVASSVSDGEKSDLNELDDYLKKPYQDARDSGMSHESALSYVRSGRWRRSGKEPEPKAGIVPPKPADNAAAKSGDQLGLFGDVANEPQTKAPALKSGGESAGKAQNLFDTHGDKDQMDLFGDGVMPESMVLKPEASSDKAEGQDKPVWQTAKMKRDRAQLGEISGLQASRMSGRELDKFNKDRDAKTDRNIDRDKLSGYSKSVIEAHDRGEFDENSEGIHPDARMVIQDHKKRTAESEHKESATKLKEWNELKPEQLSKGMKVTSGMGGEMYTVSRINSNSVTVERADGSKFRVPAGDLARIPHYDMQKASEALSNGEDIPGELLAKHPDLSAFAGGKAPVDSKAEAKAKAEKEATDAFWVGKGDATSPKGKADSAESEAANDEKPSSLAVVKHGVDVKKNSIFSDRYANTKYVPNDANISMKAFKGADAIWHHQGDTQMLTWGSADKNASDNVKQKAAELEAARDAGYKKVNHRAGKYGTVWLMEKDGRILTKRGAEALVKGTGKIDLPEAESRNDIKPHIEAIDGFFKSLPESTQENLGALNTALNRSPLGKHIRLDRGPDGKLFVSSKGENRWRISEPHSGHDSSGKFHADIESSLPRLLAKIGHMAKNDIPDEKHGWVDHDRQADKHAFSELPPGGSSKQPDKQPEAPTPSDEPPKPASGRPSGAFSLAHAAHDYKQMRSEDLTADKLREWFNHASENNGESIKAELSKKTVAELKEMGAGGWHAAGMKKGELVDDAYKKVLEQYHVGQSYQWNPMGEKHSDALRRAVEGQTDEHVRDYQGRMVKRDEETKARREEMKKAYESPESADDWRTKAKLTGGYSKLSTEDREKYDESVANARRAKEPKQATEVKQLSGEGKNLGFDLSKNYHSKRGQDIYTASPSDRVDKDSYNEMNSAAKKLGGWYYKKFGNTPSGFHFPTEESRNKFMQLQSGNVDRSEELGAKQQSKAVSRASSLRERADTLHAIAEADYSAERKDNTHRRAGMAEHAKARAAGQMSTAKLMHKIADKIDANETSHLAGVSATTHVNELKRQMTLAKHNALRKSNSDQDKWDAPASREHIEHAEYPYPSIHSNVLKDIAGSLKSEPGFMRFANKAKKLSGNDTVAKITDPDDIAMFDRVSRKLKRMPQHKYLGERLASEVESYNRLQNMDIKNGHELRSALREFQGLRGNSDTPKADPVKEAEKKLRFRKIDGFFPTPKPLVSTMLDHADIQDGHSVLEPSAGKGDIMDSVREMHPGATVSGIEKNREFSDVLKAKGHSVDFGDFLEHKGNYDRIVMNPPFEKRQDEAHVKHAFSLLKPGGRVVAVVGAGATGNQRSKDFQDWLQSVGGEVHDNPDGAFKGNDAFRQTGVNSKMIVIDKPESEKYSAALNAFWISRAGLSDDSLGEYEAVRYSASEAKKPADMSDEELGCVMLEAPPASAKLVKEIQANIPVSILTGDGLDNWPHVTVFYGTSATEIEKIVSEVKEFKATEITFGNVSVFNCEKYDVLKVEVESSSLRKMNARIKSAFPSKQTHLDYKPHMTVAYIKKGSGGKYLGKCSLSGKSEVFTRAVVSIGDKKERIDLTGRQVGKYSAREDNSQLSLVSDLVPFELVRYEWNATQHPRQAAGNEHGGEFARGNRPGGALSQRMIDNGHSPNSTRWVQDSQPSTPGAPMPAAAPTSSKKRELAEHPPTIKPGHALHASSLDPQTRAKMIDWGNRLHEVLKPMDKMPTSKLSDDEQDEAGWGKVDKNKVRSMLAEMNQMDAEARARGVRLSDFVNANQTIPKELAERLDGGSRFFDPEKIREKLHASNVVQPPSDSQEGQSSGDQNAATTSGSGTVKNFRELSRNALAQMKQNPGFREMLEKAMGLTPSGMIDTSKQRLPWEKAEEEPTAKSAAKPKPESGTNAIPTGLSKQGENKLDGIVNEAVGDGDQSKKDHFKQTALDAWRQMKSQAEEHNTAVREIMAQFTKRGHGGIAAALSKGADPTKIRGFDEMVDYAARAFPHIVSHVASESESGSSEEGLVKALTKGIQPVPQPWDDDVIDRASEMVGPHFWESGNEDTDHAMAGADHEEEIPFSVRRDIQAALIRYWNRASSRQSA